MAIAYDASSSLAGYAAGNQSWTHTPVGAPKGVLVYVVGDEGSDNVTGVTYGGTAMTEVSGSPLVKAAAEAAEVSCFFLGSSIPTGPQTVAVTATGTSSHTCVCISYTAAGDTAIEDTTTISSNSVANPSGTLTIDEDSAISVGFMSGQGAVSGITPLTGWTSRREEDQGARVVGVYTRDSNASTNTTFGWTAGADDAVGIGVAVKESGGAVTLVKDFLVSGFIPFAR